MKVNWTAVNVGVIAWPGDTTNFTAATTTVTEQNYNESPRGIAISPDGRIIIAADFGQGTGFGSRVMYLKHEKVKLAIDNDPNPYPPGSNYNLSGPSPEPLDCTTLLNGYTNIVRPVGGFDGPQNVAFQEEPVIELYPKVIYLAEGGQREGTNVLHVRVNPIYGNSITVNLNDGSMEHIMFPGDTVTFRILWSDTSQNLIDTPTPGPGDVGLGLDSAVIYTGDSVILDAQGDCVANAEAYKKKYPSAQTKIICPPQNLIQMLFAEACTDTDQIVFDALASVVKNRIRLTRDTFNRPGDPGYISDLDERLQFKYPNSQQITSENASDKKLIKDQLAESITQAQFAVVSNAKYNRALLNRTVLENEKTSYDKALRAAGNAQLDLSNTISKGRIWNLQPDPNVNDKVFNTVGGSFAFYSPKDDQWDGSTCLSIKDVLDSSTVITDFPNCDKF